MINWEEFAMDHNMTVNQLMINKNYMPELKKEMIKYEEEMKGKQQ